MELKLKDGAVPPRKAIAVTNLNERGPGSLQAALDTVGPRIITFEVEGFIYLTSPLTAS